ncbi:type II secretion system F family protein [Dietzia sp. UBA5065]|jgi:hypothetical protein|uniref:type II secretion system F family protein n=2 Tax=Dietzia TaxID=37914 RepID=UPI0025BBE95E|nr:type II secretion system F family protein [Dietzia sp. UBA5065]
MNLALLLVAAALCAAPWRGPAAGRLRDVAPGPRRRAPHPPRGMPVLSRTLDRARLGPGPAGGGRPGATGPLARMLDLLAAALLAGLPTHLALAAVGDAVEPLDPDVAEALRSVAARVRLGATPEEAWRGLPATGRLAPVASMLARGTEAGGSVQSALGHAARRMRSEADAAAAARAERAAVLVAGPLGLCFLPAFICLGVLPVVAGLADGMLPGVLP